MAPVRSRNRILGTIPADEYERLTERAEVVRFDAGAHLSEPGDTPRVYFPLDGIVSLLSFLEEGMCGEAGIAGVEGMGAIPSIDEEGLWLALALLPGEALAIDTRDFWDLTEELPAFSHAVLQYAGVALEISARLAACNHCHPVTARLARLLLLADDRRPGRLPIRQDDLALVLGAQRPTVSIACNRLRTDGLIDYRRADIMVTDRASLEAVACSCYHPIKTLLDRLLLASPAPVAPT